MTAASKSIDVIVLAGGSAAQPFRVGGKKSGKPFLRLGGKTLVRRAVEAALGAEELGRVVVVGPVDELQKDLEDLLRASGEVLSLVPEGEGILDNMLRGFFDEVLPGRAYSAPVSSDLRPETVQAFVGAHPESVQLQVLVMTSDMPFVQAADLDRFVRSAPAEPPLVVGMIDHAELEHMQRALGHHTVLDQWKLGAMPIRGVAIRLNNLWLARPLATESVIYDLVREVYDHRWMLKQDGSVNWGNWWAILRSFWRFSRKVRGRRRFLRGVFNFVPMLLATLLARVSLRVGPWLAWPFRLLLSKRDVEFVGSLLINTPTEMSISRDLGPAIDIDVEESYLRLAAEGEEDFRRVERYLCSMESTRASAGEGSQAQQQEQADQGVDRG